jgi:hypothetical protein
MEYATVIISQLARMIPLIILLIAGIVISINRWKSHPRISLLVIIASSISIIQNVLSIVTTMLPIYTHYSLSRLQPIYFIISIESLVVSLAVWAMMLVAAFSERPNRQDIDIRGDV